MGITFENTDEFGHVDASAYAKITFQAMDERNNNGNVIASIYRTQAARDADIRSNMSERSFPISDNETGETTELSDLITAMDVSETAGYKALYAFVKGKDSELDAGTDDI